MVHSMFLLRRFVSLVHVIALGLWQVVYINLKFHFYSAQFPDLTPEQNPQITIMAEYIALIHAPYFFKSPLAISAPPQDRDFWVDLLAYKKYFAQNSVQGEMIRAVQLPNHLW
jgi:hypothetical protein